VCCDKEEKKNQCQDQCMVLLVCRNLSLANQTMVPNKLNCHLLKNRPGLEFKQKSFLLTLKQNMQKEAKTLGDFVSLGRNAPLL